MLAARKKEAELREARKGVEAAQYRQEVSKSGFIFFCNAHLPLLQRWIVSNNSVPHINGVVCSCSRRFPSLTIIASFTEERGETCLLIAAFTWHATSRLLSA